MAGQAQSDLEVQNPPGQSWQSIENKKSQIIFPKGIENEAYRVASIIDYIEKNKKASIGPRSLQVPVILHNLSMEPNGFVAASPFRSEFYPLAIPDWNSTGTNNWMDLLAVHEYRHVLQASNADVGFTRLARILTGRLGWSVTRQITMPNWFAEGDAVLSETLFTASGRGRLPSFSMEQRAILDAEKKYSYIKSRHGSFKSQMPSHYPFGYTMSLFVREHYGEDSWAKVVRKSNYFQSVFYPFSGALKNVTGLRPSKIYRSAYKEMDSQTRDLLQNRNFTELTELVKPEKTVTYYSYSHPLENGNLLVRKASYKETAAIYELDRNGKERKLTNIGHSDNAYTSFGENVIVWVENKPHPYYGNVDFQRIAVYNHKLDKKAYVLEGKKAYYAAVSPDDRKIALIEFDSTMHFALNEYSLEGKKLKSHKIPQQAEQAYPFYDKNDANLLYYAIKKDGKQFWVKQDLSNDQLQEISAGYAYPMVEPTQTGDEIWFRAGFNGVDNIYSIPKDGSGVVKQLTQTRVGAGFPTSADQKIVFVNYSIKGGNLVKSEIQSQPVEISSPKGNPAFRTVNSLAENDNILEHIPDISGQPKDYKPWFDSWRLHSWGVLPGLGSFSKENKIPGLSEATVFALMDDILSYNSIYAEFTHYINEGENAYKIDWSMAPSFPVLKLGYEFRDRNKYLQDGSLVGRYNEQEIRAGFKVPLLTYKNNFSFSTNLETNIKGIKPYILKEGGVVDNTIFGLYQFAGSFAINRRQAYQNLQPKLGLLLQTDISNSFAKGKAAKQTYAGVIYLPGIGKNHGISVQLTHQYEKLSNAYQFPDNFSSGRGFQIGGLEKSTRLGFNYRLPVLYPDLGIPGITYIKRIRANAFFDMAQIGDSNVSTVVKSFGLELRADQTFLNFLPIPVGVRAGYRLPNEFLQFDSPLFFDLLIGD